jgi:hypothetical protein
MRVVLNQHVSGLGVRLLAGPCGLLRCSCGNPETLPGDAHHPVCSENKMYFGPKSLSDVPLQLQILLH